jgi:hypothetical protein
VINDASLESGEQFFINLSAPVNAVLSTTQITVSITDDEDTDGDGVANATDPYPNNRPEILVSSESAQQHNNQNRTLGGFTFTLNFPNPGQAYSATWTTVSGTATGAASCGASADFIIQTGTVSFAAGSANGATRTSPTITICPKSGTEAQEQFTVVLSSPSPASITLGAPGVGRINP